MGCWPCKPWLLTAIVLLILGIGASVAYFVLIREREKERDRKKFLIWYGIGIGAYVFLSIVAVLLVWISERRNFATLVRERDAFLEENRASGLNPRCLSEQDACKAREIPRTKQNDLVRKPRIEELERLLESNPADAAARLELKQLRDTVAADVQRLGACEKLSPTNRCVEGVVDKCKAMLEAKRDRPLLTQFEDMRKKRPASEVLSLCKGAASGIPSVPPSFF